jgi:hypothetical protein
MPPVIERSKKDILEFGATPLKLAVLFVIPFNSSISAMKYDDDSLFISAGTIAFPTIVPQT